MHIAIGSDHAGFELKEKIKTYLLQKSYEVKDEGCFSAERADYPDFGHLIARDITDKKADLGILLCGSGNGIAMSANKHSGIRAAICWKPEIAELARLHNDANILVLPARFITYEEAIECLNCFLKTSFEGGRHSLRVEKIDLS
ncbi:MAG TPA: ribose 5-phosphate isomerase B [Bacteroidia bacterium]|nr:ribose 5-phosphate isomerase B [Bacteroidia bacterium]